MIYEAKDNWLVEDFKKREADYEDFIKKQIKPVQGEPMMMLVMPVRKHCNGCPAAHYESHNFGYFTRCYATPDRRAVAGLNRDDTPDWCPAIPVPERKDEMDYLATGWNLCLDTIIEEATE